MLMQLFLVLGFVAARAWLWRGVLTSVRGGLQSTVVRDDRGGADGWMVPEWREILSPQPEAITKVQEVRSAESSCT